MKKSHFLEFFIAVFATLIIITSSGCVLTTTIEQETTPESTNQQQVETGTTSPLGSAEEIQIGSTPSQSLASIADVVAAVRPSVVAITTEVLVPSFFGGSSLEEGAGSGWIISSDGLIITNNHVIEGAQTINVTLADGTTLPVSVSSVASDEISDLAVLKVDMQGLPAVKIGNSDNLRVGDWVVAIGNSLGEGIRATQGIISRLGVTITDENGHEISGLLETDAAINPGNSGGPLVNMAGEVIGITNAKRIATGVEGVGFAISTNEAIPLIQELITKGFVTWPYLGVNTYTVDALAIREFNLQVDEGVLLTNVAAGSPADQAGLKVGDVVVRFNGQPVGTASQLISAIHKAQIGSVEIVYWRGSTQNTVTAVLIERPR